MKLGVFSDTHGNLSRAQQAVEQMRANPIDHLIHCGDLGSEDIVTFLFELQEGGLPVTAVPGNVDEWDADLMIYAKKLGIPLPRVARLTLNGLRIGIFHGHDPRVWTELLSDRTFDLLFTGHTHRHGDHLEGTLRVINPGAIHRSRDVPGYGIFDTADQSWTRKELDLL